jgi:hypothetical protein
MIPWNRVSIAVKPTGLRGEGSKKSGGRLSLWTVADIVPAPKSYTGPKYGKTLSESPLCLDIRYRYAGLGLLLGLHAL